VLGKPGFSYYHPIREGVPPLKEVDCQGTLVPYILKAVGVPLSHDGIALKYHCVQFVRIESDRELCSLYPTTALIFKN